MGHDNEVKHRERTTIMSAIPPNAVKKIKKGDLLFREGENPGAMYLIRTGMVRVFKKKGESQIEIDTLRAGGVVGEMAFLHPTDTRRQATVVTLEPTRFLEINSAALDLSSDEVRERFHKVLLIKVLGRLREANKVLATLGQAAVQGSSSAYVAGLSPPLQLL